MNSEKHPVQQIADACGGTITDGGLLPDGSGFAVMSMPLRGDHWIYGRKDPLFDAPPMILKMGAKEEAIISIGDETVCLSRHEFAEKIREAGKYAVRASTMNGLEMDFDPDAMLQNLVCAMLGYHTADGLSGCDDWANPPQFRKSPSSAG